MSQQGRPEGEHPSATHEGSPSGNAAAVLRERLSALEPVVLEIHDDSAEHAGHAGAAGGAGHFSVLIVSQAFAGLSRLQRHAEVYQRVADLLPHPVHALAIKALAPEEFPS